MCIISGNYVTIDLAQACLQLPDLKWSSWGILKRVGVWGVAFPGKLGTSGLLRSFLVQFWGIKAVAV